MALLLPNYPLPGVPNTVLPSTSVQCYCRAVCAGKGSIRYGVCLPHFIPPMAPSLRLPGFGLQASGFPISITSLSAFRTILDSPDFHLERMEANTIQFKVQYFGLTIILSTSAWFPQMGFPQSSPSELVKDFFLGGRNFLDLPILSLNHTDAQRVAAVPANQQNVWRSLQEFLIWSGVGEWLLTKGQQGRRTIRSGGC